MDNPKLRFSTKHSIAAISIFVAAVAVVSIGVWFHIPPKHAAASGSTYTWTNGGGNNNWNTGTNWSGGVVPGSSDTALFSASSTANCNINAAVNVAGIIITSGYSPGVITQNSGETITVGASGWIQSGASFTGSSAGNAITATSSFSLLGGTFKSTSGQLMIASTTFVGGTFQNNSGTVMFLQPSGAATTTITGSSTLYNVKFGNGPNYENLNMAFSLSSGTILTVQGSLYSSTWGDYISLANGEIDVWGNIENQYIADDPPLSGITPTVIKLVGTGTQLIGDTTQCSAELLTFCDPSMSIYATTLPDLTINKPSGGVTLQGTVYIRGNWNNSSTAITAGTSTVQIGTYGNTTDITNIVGSSTFNNLQLGYYAPTTSDLYNSIVISTGTIITASGTLTITYYDGGMSYLGGGGQINAQGDIVGGGNPQSYSGVVYPTSTFNLVVDGAGTQTINSTDNLGGLFLQGITINKPSGVLNLAGNAIYNDGPWVNDDAPSILNAGTSTISFVGTATTLTQSSTFYAMQIGFGYDNATQNSVTITTGTVITVQSSTVFTPNDYAVLPIVSGGGELELQGEFGLQGCWYPPAPTSTFNIVMDGTSTQLITDNGYSTIGGDCLFPIPSLTINKPSGLALVSSVYTIIPNNLTITAGELALASATWPQFFEVGGSTSISSGAIFSDYAYTASNLELGSQLTNNGLVSFDGSGLSCAASIPNDVIINSTTTGKQVPWSGSGNFWMRYVSVQDQGGTATIPVLNGTKVSDVGSNWTFNTGPEPELIQTSTAAGGSGTTQLILPAFGLKPRAGDLILVAVSAANQTIAAPTDNAGNTYTIAASSTFGSSPSYALSLYYAKDIISTSSFVVTVNGNGGSSPYLSASAFEYAGMAPSSTFDRYSANYDNSGSATTLTSFSASGQWANELYFGTMTLSNTSTVPTAGSGWTAEVGNTNNSTEQALYNEDVASSSLLTTAATWTSAATTSYAAIMGIFRAPYSSGYAASGTLDSATFDTGVVDGVELNSFTWEGNTPSNSAVDFQFAVSNSAGGPWSFEGPDGTPNSYFCGNYGTPIPLVSTNCGHVSGSGYNLFSGYRYFRYRVILYADSTYIYTPTVNQVVVNWSP